jgi:hypothetical protein
MELFYIHSPRQNKNFIIKNLFSCNAISTRAKAKLIKNVIKKAFKITRIQIKPMTINICTTISKQK